MYILYIENIEFRNMARSIQKKFMDTCFLIDLFFLSIRMTSIKKFEDENKNIQWYFNNKAWWKIINF
ncbi:hypothetical protein EGW37_02455 [Enterococcus faecium]|nr:hypothetical protein EGW37_02455 [Enterococcus faecium]